MGAFASTDPSSSLTAKVLRALVKISELKEHEEIDLEHFIKLTKEIKSDGILKKPIAVDKNTGIVLDGTHRLRALKTMGYSLIPVILLNYRSSKIGVMSWRRGEKITKDVVIKASLTKNKLPPKTSKHMVEVNGKFRHISFLEKRVDIPLEKLKGD